MHRQVVQALCHPADDADPLLFGILAVRIFALVLQRAVTT